MRLAEIAALVLAAAGSPLAAQEETLVGGEMTSGGFGGPVIRVTGVAGETAALMGGRGGWIINHAFVLGAGGYGLVTDLDVAGDRVDFGYGGLVLEYVNRPMRLVHFTLATLIGGGGVNSQLLDDGVFVIEPEAGVELNVTSFFRLHGSAGYRFVSDVDFTGLTDGDLSGAFGSLMLKFGKF
jgi:hypothetical protein